MMRKFPKSLGGSGGSTPRYGRLPLANDEIIAKAIENLTANGQGGWDGAQGKAADAPPRPNEEQLWEWLEGLANEAARARDDEARLNEFDDYLNMYYGKHWPTALPSFRPPIVANELRTLILSEAADLTDAQLRIYISKDPQNPGRDQAVERAFRAIWSREQVDLKLMYSCVWALIVGTGFLDVRWDPDGAFGLGDVAVDVYDPRHVLPDPDAIDDRKWMYVIRESVVDIPELRRLFPQSGWRVKPDDNWSVKEAKLNPSGSQSANYQGPMSQFGAYSRNLVVGYKKARARVLDCVIRDDKVEEEIEEVVDPTTKESIKDADGSPVLRQNLKPKYPNGRRIIGANGTILFDGDNPNPGGDFGLLRVILEPALGRFWGHGFVQQTSELQLAADKLLSNVVENSVRLNNGVVISTTNTGLDWESFAGIPAQIVQINPGSEFKIQYPPPMPADMVQAPWRMLDLQRRLLGFQDARAGMPGRGNVSPDLTETEISQAQSTTRLRARMLHNTVQRLAEMIFARMANGYLTRRPIPAVEGEEFKPVMWEPLEHPEKYAVYVDPASFAVMSKTMLRRLGLALYKLRAVDRQALLETIGWPDWAQTSKRMNELEIRAAYAKEAGKRAGKSTP